MGQAILFLFLLLFILYGTTIVFISDQHKKKSGFVADMLTIGIIFFNIADVAFYVLVIIPEVTADGNRVYQTSELGIGWSTFLLMTIFWVVLAVIISIYYRLHFFRIVFLSLLGVTVGIPVGICCAFFYAVRNYIRSFRKNVVDRYKTSAAQDSDGL